MRAPNSSPLSYDVRYDVMNDSPQTLNDAQRLLAELCHDVRQPLTTIRMNLQAIARLLGHPHAESEIAQALDAVSDCLDAEQELNTLFVGVSQLIRRPTVASARVDLNGVVVDAIRLYRLSRLAGRIELQLAEQSPVVNGEMSRLRYAVRSLLWDGLAFGGDGSPAERLIVATRQTTSFAELSVSGLPLPMVFGHKQSRSVALTGLVARGHGGIARIESCASAATVRIILPRAAATEETTLHQGRP